MPELPVRPREQLERTVRRAKFESGVTLLAVELNMDSGEYVASLAKLLHSMTERWVSGEDADIREETGDAAHP
jgi:hypothetical protein